MKQKDLHQSAHKIKSSNRSDNYSSNVIIRGFCSENCHSTQYAQQSDPKLFYYRMLIALLYPPWKVGAYFSEKTIFFSIKWLLKAMHMSSVNLKISNWKQLLLLVISLKCKLTLNTAGYEYEKKRTGIINFTDWFVNPLICIISICSVRVS